MSLKRYYDILGLPENTELNDVRKRYRKLAMQYHPDKNSSSNAKEQFLLITDAYEILVGKKEVPIQSRVHISRSKEKSNEERVKEAKKRYFEQIRKEKQENEKYFKSLFVGNKWKIVKIGSILGPILSALLLIDYFLPNHYENDKVTHYAKSFKNGEVLTNRNFVRTANGHDFWISDMDFKLYGAYPNIYIERSWIFHQPINLVSAQKIKYANYPAQFTFRSVSFILILFFLLPLFVRLYKQKTVWYTFLYHLSLYLSSILLIVFLISNDHWAHILTLGFL